MMANVKLKILLISCADSQPGAIERILVPPRHLHAMQESLPAGWERITLEFDDRHHGAVRFVPLRGHHLISSSFRPFFFLPPFWPGYFFTSRRGSSTTVRCRIVLRSRKL